MVAVRLYPDRDCRTCTDDQKRIWGCHAKKLDDGSWQNPAITSWVWDGEESFVCPRRPILDDPETYEYLFTSYGWYKNGFLPEDGAMKSQAGKWTKMIHRLDILVGQVDEYEAEKKKKGSGKGGGAPRG